MLNENGTMTITRCTISNNSAQQQTIQTLMCICSGGGILNYSGGSLTITNSTISGNSCSAIPSAASGAGRTAAALQIWGP